LVVAGVLSSPSGVARGSRGAMDARVESGGVGGGSSVLVQLSHVGAALGVAAAVGGLLLLLPSGGREEVEEVPETLADDVREPPLTRPARDVSSPRDDVDAPKDMASNAGARQ